MNFWVYARRLFGTGLHILMPLEYLIINILKMDNPQQKKCNQCLEFFSITKRPLKMPGCKHNICEQCLQEIREVKLDVINCSFCQSSVVKLQSQKFEINRLLMTKIRDSKKKLIQNSSETSVSINADMDEPPDNNQFLLTEDEEVPQIKISCAPAAEPEYCKQHQKQYEIICLTDLKMICPHCAIFGNHKDHNFKTLKQFKKDYQQKYEKLQMIKKQKYLQQKKQKNLKEKQNIQKTIQNRKTQVRAEVTTIFKKLTKQIEDLQVSICEELNKSFSAVYKDVVSLFSQESKIDQQYTQWESQCQNLFEQMENSQSIDSKIKSLYGPLSKVAKGQDLIDRLNKKIELITKKINSLVNSVSVQVKADLDLSKFIKVNRKQEDSKKQNFMLLLQQIPMPSGKHILQDLDFNQNSFVFEPQESSFVSQTSIKRPPAKSLMGKRSPQVKQAPITQRFRSPNNTKCLSPGLGDSLIIRSKSNTDLKINELIQNTSSPNIFQTSMMKIQIRDPASVVADFIKHDLKQVLDLSRCDLDDQKLIRLVKEVRKHRKIRGLKLCQNNITDAGFEMLIDFIGSTSNMNLSYNKLTQQSLSLIIKYRDKLSPLRIVNMSFNNVNDKKSKTRIDTLKKMGIIINI